MSTDIAPAAEQPASPGEHSSERGAGQQLKERFGRAAGAVLLVGLILLAGWLGSLLMLAAIGALLLSVMLHELGHLLTARWCGMKVTDYYVGFGPKLLSFKRGETNYGVRLIPAGGYVTIVGMHSGEKVNPADEARTYRAKSFPRRALVISAGSIMHFLMAVVAMFAIHAFTGWLTDPSSDEHWRVQEIPAVLSDGTPSPALAAGLQPGDKVISVDGQPTPGFLAMQQALQAKPNDPVLLGVQRGESTLTLPATLASNADGQGLLGIRIGWVRQSVTQPLHVAAVFAVRDLGWLLWQSVWGLGQLATNAPEFVDAVVSAPGDSSANENLAARPVSVIGLVDLASTNSVSLSDLLFLFALVNAFFGLFNLLPLLPLDGGHLAIATYERWRERNSGGRHMVDMRRLMPAMYAGVALIAALGLGAIYLDIANPLDLG